MIAYMIAFMTVTAPCDVSKVKAATQVELVEAKRLTDEAASYDADIGAKAADIVQEQRIIATERANPSGVVDLATLHAAGEQIQYDRNQIDHDKLFRDEDLSQARKILDHVTKELAACRR